MYKYICKYIYKYIFIHTLNSSEHFFRLLNIYIYIYIYLYINIRLYIPWTVVNNSSASSTLILPIYKYIYVHVIQTYKLIFMHKYMDKNINVYICIYIHMYIYKCMHTHICVFKNIQVYIYRYIYIPVLEAFLVSRVPPWPSSSSIMKERIRLSTLFEIFVISVTLSVKCGNSKDIDSV
jgi:hypothetical protein